MKTMSETPEQMPDNATDRPLVTFALLAYNQEKYIREAVEGAFSQTYEPLEIILSDDYSSDKTFEIMQQLANTYNGPHKIVLNRNPSNKGLCDHVNTVFGLSHAEIIVLAAGDDISLPDRVLRTAKIFDLCPNVQSVSMEYCCIKDSGALLANGGKRYASGKYDLQSLIAGYSIPTHGCTRAYKTKLLDTFGPLNTTCKIEDAPLRLRSLFSGSIYHCNTEGILYRKHSAALSTSIDRKKQLGVYRQNLQDLNVAVSNSMLQDHTVGEIKRAVRSHISRGLAISLHQGAHYKLLNLIFTIFPSSKLSWKDKTYLLYGTATWVHGSAFSKLMKKLLR